MKKIFTETTVKMFIKTCWFLLVIIIIPKFSAAQNLLNGPEGIVFDAPNNRYLVTNANNGTIVQIDSNGIHSLFKSGLSVPLGMHIVGNTLYVSTNSPTVLKGFDLSTTDSVMIVPIPTAVGLSGISSDTSGNLYIADQGGKIFKVRISDQNVSTFVGYGLPNGPQGVFVEQQKNRLLLVSFQLNSPIVAIDLSDSTVSIIVNTTIGQFTAIAKDDECNFYVCSWRTGSVHKYDSAFSNPPLIFSSGHSQPTGLFYNGGERILAVSNFGSSTVDFIPVPPISVGNNGQELPQGFDLKQNYPNPFNPHTTIEYDIHKLSNVVLKIYNVLGKEIITLVKEKQTAGIISIVWDGKDCNGKIVDSGMYIYVLKIGENIQSSKMVLLK